MARGKLSRAKLLLSLFLAHRRKRRTQRKRKMWIRSIFAHRRQQGEYHNLLQEMRLSDPDSHFRYLRMSKERFDCLLAEVSASLSRCHYDSSLRAAISPAEKLALTLRFLGTGNSQVSLSFSFRMGRSTVCDILKQTCEVIWDILHPQYIKAPTTEAEWESISRQFEQLWNFPHCIGAIDGKHVALQAPINAGSTFFN